MDPATIVVFVVVAGVAGVVAEAVVGYRTGGLLASIAVGLVGALIGFWLADHYHLPGLILIHPTDTTVDLGYTILGAILFLVAVAFFRSRPD